MQAGWRRLPQWSRSADFWRQITTLNRASTSTHLACRWPTWTAGSPAWKAGSKASAPTAAVRIRLPAHKAERHQPRHPQRGVLRSSSNTSRSPARSRKTASHTCPETHARDPIPQRPQPRRDRETRAARRRVRRSLQDHRQIVRHGYASRNPDIAGRATNRIDTHRTNEPGARHICERLERVDPRHVVPGGRLDLLMASPECTHHSNARGDRPVSDQQRASAWIVLRWAEALYIRSILIENVPEFASLGAVRQQRPALKAQGGRDLPRLPRRAALARLPRRHARTDRGRLRRPDHPPPAVHPGRPAPPTALAGSHARAAPDRGSRGPARHGGARATSSTGRSPDRASSRGRGHWRRPPRGGSKQGCASSGERRPSRSSSSSATTPPPGASTSPHPRLPPAAPTWRCASRSCSDSSPAPPPARSTTPRRRSPPAGRSA